ncbi:MAG: TusE/DsrC/DsvC family sulfur relay protein [Polyangiaceae bacterium]|nr:TusE/DsrC/DsvC family sulfur relay protein [Polyangiaceae bacterium]
METTQTSAQKTEPRAPTNGSTLPNDAAALMAKRMEVMEEQLAYLVKRQRAQEELFADLTPIGKDLLNVVTERFSELEKEGAISFAQELLAVTRKVVQHYGPEDVRQFGNAVVTILDTVRALTQPEVLAIAGQASTVLQNADQAEPIGIMGMVRASRNEDVQKGMAVMMELLKHVGHAAKAMAEQRREPTGADKRKADLAKRLGPKKKKVLGVERPQVIEDARQEARDLGPPVLCADPAVKEEPEAAATMLDGVGFTADGHLANPKAWTRDLALNIAHAQGVELDDARWKVVEFARADFEEHGVSPNVRRLTLGTGLATRDLYTMFPKAPARTIAKIAGIPKPAGCI